jgi:2-methylisocitrate lyase-like PEP mutase family enzyme
MSSKGKRLKAALGRKGLVTAPGIYDMISARMADRMGFPALYMTGYGVVASHLGIPDAGLASYTEMVGRVAQICQGTETPVVCDADTGFGGLLNVERTVRGYQAAGAAAIQIEDQAFPKKCGHTLGRRVVPMEDMVRKVQVAAATRDSKDFLIVARTDARTSLGLDEALRRGEAYAEAGADVLFIESPESEAEMERICRSFDVPLLINVVDGGRTPVLPKARLEALGFKLAIFPATGFLATAKALETVYGVLKEKGSTDTLTDEVYSFDGFTRMIGFEKVWEFEKRWPEVEADGTPVASAPAPRKRAAKAAK